MSYLWRNIPRTVQRNVVTKSANSRRSIHSKNAEGPLQSSANNKEMETKECASSRTVVHSSFEDKVAVGLGDDCASEADGSYFVKVLKQNEGRPKVIFDVKQHFFPED